MMHQTTEKIIVFKPWGLSTLIDLKECNPDLIRNSEKIKSYAKELCKLIDMKPFGECKVIHFGEDERVAGYSMTQLIETSLISGHFSNMSNGAYIDIFSCKEYNGFEALRFTSLFFEAKDFSISFYHRW